MASNKLHVVSRNIDNHNLVVRETISNGIIADLSADTHEGVSPESRLFLAHLISHAESLLASLCEVLPLAVNEKDRLELTEFSVAKEKIMRAEETIQTLARIGHAFKVLKAVTKQFPNTIIDSGYEEYLNEEPNQVTLLALLAITGKDNYKELLEEYEGFTIEQLIKG